MLHFIHCSSCHRSLGRGELAPLSGLFAKEDGSALDQMASVAALKRLVLYSTTTYSATESVTVELIKLKRELLAWLAQENLFTAFVKA
jgi:hypothetical protein